MLPSLTSGGSTGAPTFLSDPLGGGFALLTGHHLADLRFAASYAEDFRLAQTSPNQVPDLSIFSDPWSLEVTALPPGSRSRRRPF